MAHIYPTILVDPELVIHSSVVGPKAIFVPMTAMVGRSEPSLHPPDNPQQEDSPSQSISAHKRPFCDTIEYRVRGPHHAG